MLYHCALCASYATTRRSRLYYPSSSVFACSPPCGSCSVFEVAHSVNKNASNMYPFGCGCPTQNCNEVAISLAQSANIIVAIGNNITHTLRAYHLRCRCGSCSVFEVTHFVYKYAWFLKKCRKNIKNSAKTALKCLQKNFIYNIIHSEPASQRSAFCSVWRLARRVCER